MTKETTESDLVSLIQQRSTHGFSMLYDKYAGIVFDVISKIVEDEASAEDILEKTFVKVWSDISEYDAAKEGLLTWIISIARTLGIEHLKNSNHEQRNADMKSPPDMLSHIEPQYMEAIEMIFLKGYSYEEAAQILQIPIDTLKNRVRTVLKLFRNNK